VPRAGSGATFSMGRPIGADVSELEGRLEFRATMEVDLHRIRIGNERLKFRMRSYLVANIRCLNSTGRLGALIDGQLELESAGNPLSFAPSAQEPLSLDFGD